MKEFLSNALHPVILSYVISGMLALGISQAVKLIFEPLKNVHITISAIVANSVFKDQPNAMLNL